jgi:DNA-binding SARP family transcriptional activator
VDLGFLGPFEVVGGAGPVPVGAAKQRALLALLALRANQVVSTSQLIDGLWGEDPPATAVKTIQGHVARVRRALESAGLPGVLVTRDPGYFLAADPDRVDAVRFERHAQAGRRALAGGDPLTAARELETGLGLWRGDALVDCREASEVIAAEAVRLDELRWSAIEDRLDADLALGRHAAIVGDLEALLSRQPLRERLWATLMVALYRSQRQSEALRAYQRARDALVEGLGVEPSAELRRLEAAILQGDPDLDLAPDVRPSASTRLIGWSIAGPALVGRDAELATLTGWWERARLGEAQMAVIGGEPGIGKTRLAAELAVRVDADGATVLSGRCDENLDVPYQPFVEALRGCIEGVHDDGLCRLLGRYPGELVRLVPELATRLPGLAEPLRSDPATEQYRLFEAVVEWLVAVAEVEPTVFVLDDLHWATQPTVLLLRHVIRSDRLGRLLVLGTYRHSELRRGHPLAEMLADTHVSSPVRTVHRLELEGLDVRDVASFVATASGRDLDEAGRRFAAAVHVETAGNPFFVNEVVRSLLESGAIEAGGAPVGTAAAWPEVVRIPPAARDVVLRRVERLPEEAQHALTTGAVVGAEFASDVLERLLPLDSDALLAALEDANAAGLVDEAGPGRFAFAHAIVRGALYDRLSESRRIRLHGQIGDAIERVYAHELGNHLSELAYHYADADPEKALRYAIDAARDALERLAFQDAVSICRRGVDAIEKGRATGAPLATGDECDLLVALGTAELRAGDPAGRKTLLRAYEVARSLADPHRQATALLAVNRGFFSRIGRTDRELVDALEHAIAAQAPGDTRELAALRATLASEIVWSSDGERRFALSDDALAMARRVGDPRTLARVLMLRSMTIPAPDTLEERLAIGHELLSLAEELEDPTIRFDTAFSHSGTAWEAGDVGAINEMEELAGALAAELRQPRLVWQASFMRTARRLLEGSLDAAEIAATETLELGRLAGQEGEAFIFYNEQLLEIRRWQGRLGELIGDFREVAGSDDFDFGCSLTRYLYDGGEIDAARDAYSSVMQRVTLPPRRDMLAITTLYNLAYLAARFDDGSRAGELYAALEPHATVFTSTTVAKPVGWHFLGLLAGTLGDMQLAREHLEQAVQAHEAVRAPLLLAESRLELARVLIATGADRAHAAALLDAVSSVVDRHGAGFLGLQLREVEQQL